MKILIATPLYPPEIGGPATYTALLERELPKRGVEVRVVKFADVRSSHKIIRHLKFLWLVFKNARGCDLVYAQDPVSVGLPALFATKLRRKKFVLKVVGDYAWEQGKIRFKVRDSLEVFSGKYFFYHPAVTLFKITQTMVASLADEVIVPSAFLQTVVTDWGVKKDKVKVVYNSLEMATFSLSQAEVREELGLKGFVMFSAGRLVPWKGFVKVILAVAELKEVIPDIKLIIAGSGPDEEKLRNLINIKNLQDHVLLVGQLKQDNLFKYIKASDIFVLNTLYEGLSHQLLEVMSLEVPILSTYAGGNPEIIKSGESGVLVEPDNMEELKAAILWLYKSPDHRIKIATAAKKSLVKFNVSKMVDDLLNNLKLN